MSKTRLQRILAKRYLIDWFFSLEVIEKRIWMSSIRFIASAQEGNEIYLLYGKDN